MKAYRQTHKALSNYLIILSHESLFVSYLNIIHWNVFKRNCNDITQWAEHVGSSLWLKLVLLSERRGWTLAAEGTNGAIERLVSLRQKENIYSKCWALKSFVTHHPLLRIVINPAFCQTALLETAPCQRMNSPPDIFQLALVCHAAALVC